ncbi:MAG TPA: YceI family protein [Chitinophagaceae bacterium]|nr:YceI family protein [Chitinophagaceae bacterium]
MTKKALTAIVLIATVHFAHAQLYFTTTGFAGFYSKTQFEDIKAENNQVYAVIDVNKKAIAFSMLLNGFVFAKELMQEHFNENYAESDKYPKATFTGTYIDNIDLSSGAQTTIHVSGTLTLHGVSKPFSTAATLALANGVLTGQASFQLVPGDFNISIPSLVRSKIAGKIDVHITANCKPRN